MVSWLIWTFLACGGVEGDAQERGSDGDTERIAVQVADPDLGCVRDAEMDGPPGGVCDDVTVVHLSPDGTCWYVSCMWEDMRFPEDAGGSGIPADPDWCRDTDWFFEQPRCDTDAP